MMISREQRTFLRALVGGCPFEEVSCDCPFIEIRQRDLKERVEWPDQLSAEVANEIIAHHKQCSVRKEKQETQ